MGRPWWYDSYGQKKEKQRRRLLLPSRKVWVWVALVLLSLFLVGLNTGFQSVLLDWILSFIAYFCRILAMSVLVLALLSWFRIGAYSWPMTILFDITDPILMPLRRVFPTFGGMDLTPLFAMLILYFIPSVVGGLVSLFI